MRRSMLVAGIAAAITAAAPAAAAVTKPTVTTGGHANVTQTSATLLGSVNPNGARTTYLFQYGTSKLYGSSTGPADAGAGTRAKSVTADLSGLTPNTTYHYRLVASNSKGTTLGGDRTFKTLKQPLGFSLTATPNPVTWGMSTTLSGQLTGTGGGGRTVKLQQNAFPYTAGFSDVGNQIVTDAAGNFSFTVPVLTVNTQFRAVDVNKPNVPSPVVIVASAVRVGVKVSATRARRGHRIVFSGHVTPANDGALYAVQRLKNGQWVTVVGGSLRHGTTTSSRYRKTLHLRHAGKYRVFVGVNNQNTSGISREIRLRLRG